MRVAIVGAGAAGLATAWMLDPMHDVVVFEREPTAGGHVRTLGGNVKAPAGLPRLDMGVIELEERNFPTVARLLDALGVRRVHVPGTTTLLRRDGTRLLSPGSIWDSGHGVVEDVRDAAHLAPHMRALREFLQEMEDRGPLGLHGHRLAEFLPDGVAGEWLSLLVLYAYSTPLDEVPDVAADLAGPMLHAFSQAERWYAIEGGTFTWMARVLDGLRGALRTSCAPTAIHRLPDGVQLDLPDGTSERFDAVVLAVPPHEVLGLLADPSDAERRAFMEFQGRVMHTTLHHDDGPYTRRGQTYRAEFDCFDLGPGCGAYNARLDRLCALPDDAPPWGLAYGLDDELDPAKIVRRQPHVVSAYTTAAMTHRPSARALSGQRHTFFAGAWLGDGLHEGAITSAVAVSETLGGRVP
jgi:predicted NAD/FAD-binding protein